MLFEGSIVFMLNLDSILTVCVSFLKAALFNQSTIKT